MVFARSLPGSQSVRDLDGNQCAFSTVGSLDRPRPDPKLVLDPASSIHAEAYVKAGWMGPLLIITDLFNSVRHMKEFGIRVLTVAPRFGLAK